MAWQGVNTREKIWHLTEIAASQYETHLELFSVQGITVLKWRRFVEHFLQICKYSINIATLKFLVPLNKCCHKTRRYLSRF